MDFAVVQYEGTYCVNGLGLLVIDSLVPEGAVVPGAFGFGVGEFALFLIVNGDAILENGVTDMEVNYLDGGMSICYLFILG